MNRVLVATLALLFGAALEVLAQSPPVGGNQPVQATKTGSYTIKSTDLKTVIPFNCPAPCTVTMPASTSTWPKGYPVTILNSGTTTVTVHATPASVIYGMPLTGGDVQLTAQGNYAVLTADKANNYAAYGATGAGAGPPPTTFFRLTNSNGKRLTNSNGFRLTNGS